MPTVQVSPTASGLLQDVADSLFKSKKVVVVTGAGISTNSGIPDFRSEHGLYSLIQAQFEKAEAAGPSGSGPVEDEGDISQRPSKRRRISKELPSSMRSSPPSTWLADVETDKGQNSVLTTHEQTRDIVIGADCEVAAESLQAETVDCPLPSAQAPLQNTRSQTLSRPDMVRQSTESSSQSTSCSDAIFSAPECSAASSETEGSLVGADGEPGAPPVHTSTPKKNLTAGPYSSSPLSSPPPIIFDPYKDDQSEDGSSRDDSASSDDDSESEDNGSSTDFFPSQNSRSGLRNMKGRDLFDCNIWSDPLKTSVFYRFATTLRQKVREVEPTTTHHFIARLRDVGKLARVYTQNIDEIEKKIGLSTDLKNGAGNKRRRSTKQPQLIDQDKEAEEAKVDDDPGSKGGSQSSQALEDGDGAKPKVSYVVDKGVECVFLHGSLDALRCFVCGRLSDWDDDGRESCTMAGEQPECPHCAGATAARQERGKRALGVGKLRPDIVLYGEEHPQSDSISSIVQHDLSAGPDLLLVLGTSLRVHGLKVMVKEFAKSVHNKGGKVVFVNFTKPSESTWGDVIDYWVEWDCDAWVDDLKDRKPVLWMTPEAALEHEKQERDAKRGEKREALAEKKRESISLKKRRESVSEKKQDGIRVKRRQTIQMPELPPAEPRAPPKNPSAMRNDYFCAAYCLSSISEAFSMLRGEPFDLLGYTAPPSKSTSTPQQVTAVKAPRQKRARKSAPAALGLGSWPAAEPNLGSETPQRDAESGKLSTGPAAIHTLSSASPRAAEKQLDRVGGTMGSFEFSSKEHYKRAVFNLVNARPPGTSQRNIELQMKYTQSLGAEARRSHIESLVQTLGPDDRTETKQGHEEGKGPSSSPPFYADATATPTVPLSAPNEPSRPSIVAAVKSNPRIRKPKTIWDASANLSVAPTRQRANTVVSQTAHDQENILPPLRLGPKLPSAPRLATMEPVPDLSPRSPLAPEPNQSPLASLSPNQRAFGLLHLKKPMMVIDPLAGWQFAVRRDSARSPSDQLREETEAAAGLIGLGISTNSRARRDT